MINIGPTVVEKKDDQDFNQLDRNLYLKNGEVFSPREALSAINTVSDLKNFVENEDDSKTTYFDWSTIVEHLVPKLTAEEQLFELESLISEKLSKEISKEKYLGRLHIAISQRYVEFGNLKLAWNHAQRALAFTNPSGWAPYWDGGVRLKSLRLLNSVNPDKTREFIFDLYATDLSERSYYPTSFVLHLHEILEVLSKKIPIPEIGAEIEYYLNDLFVSVDVGEVQELEYALEDPDDLLKNDNPRLAIIELLFLYLAYPSYPIAQGAVTGLTELLLKGTGPIADVFNLALSSNNNVLVERLLMVLDAISLNDKHPTILNTFRAKLGNLCYSPNFAIRLNACRIIAQIENSPPKIGFNDSQLPTIYHLELPEVSLHESWQAMKGEQTPILMGDLARRIQPLDEEMRVIARIVNLPVDNIFYRAVHFFEIFLLDRIWLDDGKPLTEKSLIAFLDNTGVWTSHNKPHIFAARQALAYVIAELWDCGYLGMDNIGTFQMMLITDVTQTKEKSSKITRWTKKN